MIRRSTSAVPAAPLRARPNARRLTASARHFSLGCSHAPRPTIRRRSSTTTADEPLPSATSRSSSDRDPFFRASDAGTLRLILEVLQMCRPQPPDEYLPAVHICPLGLPALAWRDVEDNSFAGLARTRRGQLPADRPLGAGHVGSSPSGARPPNLREPGRRRAGPEPGPRCGVRGGQGRFVGADCRGRPRRRRRCRSASR